MRLGGPRCFRGRSRHHRSRVVGDAGPIKAVIVVSVAQRIVIDFVPLADHPDSVGKLLPVGDSCVQFGECFVHAVLLFAGFFMLCVDGVHR